MSNHLAVPMPELDSHPGLTRTRSSSSPTTTRDDINKIEPIARPARPTHSRSRSYISPSELKPANVSVPTSILERPNETSRFHRLHLPGRNHHHHHHHNAEPEDGKQLPRVHHGRHKYSQSESQQYQRKRDFALPNSDSSGTPIIITTPVSSSSELPLDVPYPSSRGTAIPSLKRMTTNRSHRGITSSEIGLMATLGDPRSGLLRTPSELRNSLNEPLHPAQVHKSPIELQLDRADAFRKASRENLTDSDIKRREIQLDTATIELQDRLTQTTRSASDLMRRLDDAQDTLSRTTESLVDTISSFSNLSDQSSKLVHNFTHEANHLDRETLDRVKRFQDSIVHRRKRRVDELECRGQGMSSKAEELGRRLENCRAAVKAWEERELSKRKAIREVWITVGWAVTALIVFGILGIVGWKAFVSDRHGIAADGLSNALSYAGMNNNGSYDIEMLKELHVPDDVKDILIDINARVRDGKSLDQPLTEVVAETESEQNDADDERLRLLDEL